MGLCGIVTLAAGYPPGLGIQFGLYAMLGDLLSSFTKRRLGIPVSDRALGLDQIPEALLPLWLLREGLGIDMQEVVLLVTAFLAIEIVLSKLLYRWHIRKRPY